MKATTVMVVAVGALALGHWANGKNAIPSAKGLVEIVFAVLVIAFLDQGETEPIAKGFAWLFLAAVLLRNDSLLTSLANVSSKPATTTKKKA